MAVEHNSSHSFNFRLSSEQDRNPHSSHRRHNSEPVVTTTLPGVRRKSTNLSSLMEELRPHSGVGDIACGLSPDRLSPAPRLKPQYSIRRPRPNTENFGLSFAPEIVLGEPKEHIGHPKTRIGQPALKLAAIKERMEHLEAVNERLLQRVESYRTDVEMLSSSVTYFSSEYYAGLLTIRDLRARSREDAEIMNTQEQQLCQLKKFVGLMVEIGRHEPVLERAHESVLAGEQFEPVLVDAIRAAAARRGSAWAGIVSAVNVFPGPARAAKRTDAPDVFDGRHSTVDDLLKSLEDGDIPSGRHRSATLRFSAQLNKSPLRNRPAPPRNSLHVKYARDPAVPLHPHSPVRAALARLDVNRSPPHRKGSQGQLYLRSNKPATQENPSTDILSIMPAEGQQTGNPPCTSALMPRSAGSNTPFSTQRALASLQRILGNFSLGSLGTTTEGSQSAECDSSAVHTTVAKYSAQLMDGGNSATPIQTKPSIVPPAVNSPPRLRVQALTVCSFIPKAVSSGRRTKHLTVIPSPAKKLVVDVGGSPGRGRRTSDSGSLSKKGGWR